MPRFVTIGYGDEEGYRRTELAVRNAAHAQDAKLLEGGATIGMAGKPVQVRNPDSRAIAITEGPFMATALPLAGFAIIEAGSLDEAVAMVAQTPCAVAHGVVEVWPLDEGD
ncbi:MAG: YciI family protein [Croceibacterium sp.]